MGAFSIRLIKLLTSSMTFTLDLASALSRATTSVWISTKTEIPFPFPAAILNYFDFIVSRKLTNKFFFSNFCFMFCVFVTTGVAVAIRKTLLKIANLLYSVARFFMNKF